LARTGPILTEMAILRRGVPTLSHIRLWGRASTSGPYKPHSGTPATHRPRRCSWR